MISTWYCRYSTFQLVCAQTLKQLKIGFDTIDLIRQTETTVYP